MFNYYKYFSKLYIYPYISNKNVKFYKKTLEILVFGHNQQ